MNRDLLIKHAKRYIEKQIGSSGQIAKDWEQREERINYYRGWTAARIGGMNRDELYEYLAKLWAMLIWGNKDYVVDKLIADNGLKSLLDSLANLIWGSEALAVRWDNFRSKIKGIGPAMMSELLVYVHPRECLLWNRRAYVGFNYLGVENLPRYNYQLTGKRYVELCNIGKQMLQEMAKIGFEPNDLLALDFFIWSELQVVENLNEINKPAASVVPSETDKLDKATADFVHNEVRDKIADIGAWLGLRTMVEVKVASGAKVDAIWEATIGNMGRVIYVFEVQTKGSIDSLVLNLLKALNNPAVQGVVAVSDKAQLAKIEKEAESVQGLKGKLKYWDYAQVLETHEALESVNATINALGLVPQGF